MNARTSQFRARWKREEEKRERKSLDSRSNLRQEVLLLHQRHARRRKSFDRRRNPSRHFLGEHPSEDANDGGHQRDRVFRVSSDETS